MLKWLIRVGVFLIVLFIVIGVIVALVGNNRVTDALNQLETNLERDRVAIQQEPAPAVTTRTETGTITQDAISVANPDDPTQSEIRHPASYVETGISNRSVTYRINVPANHVGIIGAFQVDSQSGGVYMALRPGQYRKTVFDGFVLIIRQEWAQEEWNFRLNQARRQGWALQHIDNGPLGSTTVQTQDTANNLIQPEEGSVQPPPSTGGESTSGQRQTTGVSGTLQFSAGVPVCGDTIVLQTGRTFRSTCFHSAPSAGTVTNGVIYPNQDEFRAINIDPK